MGKDASRSVAAAPLPATAAVAGREAAGVADVRTGLGGFVTAVGGSACETEVEMNVMIIPDVAYTHTHTHTHTHRLEPAGAREQRRR